MPRKQIISLLLMLVFSQQAWAFVEEPFPSHCRDDEHVYLNAKMDYEPSPQGARLSKKRGIVLSICANRNEEPISVLAVRHGLIGTPELELIGDSNKKIKIFLERVGPSMALQIFIFSIGRRTYIISEGVGLENGISFRAIEGKKTMSYGKSSEYQHGTLEIDFKDPKSPLFIRKRPRNFVP